MTIAVFAAQAGDAADPAQIAAGKSLAEAACSACHKVGPGQPQPGAGEAGKDRVKGPSFTRIARDRRNDGLYLHSFIKFPHYPMRDLSLSEGQIDSLVAYILSLRKKASPKPAAEAQ